MRRRKRGSTLALLVYHESYLSSYQFEIVGLHARGQIIVSEFSFRYLLLHVRMPISSSHLSEHNSWNYIGYTMLSSLESPKRYIWYISIPFWVRTAHATFQFPPPLLLGHTQMQPNLSAPQYFCHAVSSWLSWHLLCHLLSSNWRHPLMLAYTGWKHDVRDLNANMKACISVFV